MKNRIKNVYFVIGLVGIALTAAGISPDTITSWDLLFYNFISILRNPFMLVTVLMAVLGVFVDPTTPGLNDNNNKGGK